MNINRDRYKAIFGGSALGRLANQNLANALYAIKKVSCDRLLHQNEQVINELLTNHLLPVVELNWDDINSRSVILNTIQQGRTRVVRQPNHIAVHAIKIVTGTSDVLFSSPRQWLRNWKHYFAEISNGRIQVMIDAGISARMPLTDDDVNNLNTASAHFKEDMKTMIVNVNAEIVELNEVIEGHIRAGVSDRAKICSEERRIEGKLKM